MHALRVDRTEGEYNVPSPPTPEAHGDASPKYWTRWSLYDLLGLIMTADKQQFGLKDKGGTH